MFDESCGLYIFGVNVEPYHSAHIVVWPCVCCVSPYNECETINLIPMYVISFFVVLFSETALYDAMPHDSTPPALGSSTAAMTLHEFLTLVSHVA
jgi:hypothetical protein